MSQELFQAVQQAEESADQIIQNAQHTARELLKDTGAEIKAQERKAALACRTEYQRILEQKRQAVAKQIEDQRPQVLSQQQESLTAARARLDQVSQMLFERIWHDGDR